MQPRKVSTLEDFQRLDVMDKGTAKEKLLLKRSEPESKKIEDMAEIELQKPKKIDDTYESIRAAKIELMGLLLGLAYHFNRNGLIHDESNAVKSYLFLINQFCDVHQELGITAQGALNLAKHRGSLIFSPMFPGTLSEICLSMNAEDLKLLVGFIKQNEKVHDEYIRIEIKKRAAGVTDYFLDDVGKDLLGSIDSEIKKLPIKLQSVVMPQAGLRVEDPDDGYKKFRRAISQVFFKMEKLDQRWKDYLYGNVNPIFEYCHKHSVSAANAAEAIRKLDFDDYIHVNAAGQYLSVQKQPLLADFISHVNNLGHTSDPNRIFTKKRESLEKKPEPKPEPEPRPEKK